MATPFDFGGLLGGTFGGGLSGLEDLLTPEQRAAIQRQSGLSAAAALLQAAGPSTTRTSLGQALGSAFTAGQAGMQKGTESALTQMLARQKLDEAKRARDLQANIAKILTGGAAPAGGEVTAEEALAVPGMAAGPTPERAALIGQPRPQAAGPQMSGSELKARQYRQMADVYAASGKGEEAKRFMDIAESLAPSRQEVMGQPFEVIGAEGKPVMVQQFKDGTLKPVQGFSGRQKVTGQPFEVTAADGNAVLVQQYEDGSVRTMPGYGPKREVVLQNLNNRIVAVDKSKLKGGESLAVGMTPAEQENLNIARKRLKLSQDEFDRGAYDRTETADGSVVYVPKTPGMPVIPVVGAGGQPVMGAGAKPPEAFNKATRQLADLKGSIKDYKDELAKGKWVVPKNVPIPFTGTGIPMPTGEDSAAVASRYNALLMGVKNLYELGALTGPDLSIIETQITNPASWAGLMTSTNAMNQQVKVLEDLLSRAEENLKSSYRPGVGMPAGFRLLP